MSEHPLVYMSTESALKHEALARAMERVGIPVAVDGKKVDSGVNEQPQTMEETYQGAMNRHKALRALGVEADYYATIESGLHQVHEAHGVYGCNVVIIERTGNEPHVGFALDIEFPEEVLSLVPSVYDDIGVWAQQVHGAEEKDPYPYLTHNRLTRRDTVEAAVFNVALQLDQENV